MVAFFRFADFLFSANFNQAHRLLTQLLADSDFETLHTFLEQQATLPCCHGNNLGSYLIMPVQRMYESTNIIMQTFTV